MDNNVVDKQTRKWLVTINNPIDKGFTRDKIIEIIENMKNVNYACFSDEKGEQGTFHTHIFICFLTPRKFSTLKNAFNGAHFDYANGSCSQNRDYVFKQGKWENDKKADTNIFESHWEYGEMPIEKQGKRTDLDDLYAMIRLGYTNVQILEQDSSYMKIIDKIDKVRQELLFDKYRNIDRILYTTYVFGKTGTGKTRDIMQRHGYENVYRITDYKHPFDNYKGQDVIVFDEFRSNFTTTLLLDLLDRYPCELPGRYTNKCACYTKVYIVSNIPLCEQYPNLQREEKESYQAFLRRINKVQHYTNDTVIHYTMDEYREIMYCVDCPIEQTPFFI